jgi:hypothetical protein
MSPRNQLSSTIGDELKMSSNQKAKVFGIALKDRSAILPAGHAANGAFWYDDETGHFITSSWYMNELPLWLKDFNAKQYPKTYLQQGWNTLYPIRTYSSSIDDENNFEAVPNKKDKPVFPYDYKSFLDKSSWAILKATPYGNTISKELAKECILHEEMGKDDITDLLCLSFSSTDIVTHSYGPRAVEVEDIYLRLDKDIEDLLNFLDKQVGKNNYIVFLTADHGGADVPAHLISNKIPAGYLRESKVLKQLRTFCKNNFSDSTLVANVSNEQVFLNDKKIIELNLNKTTLEEKLADFLITLPGIAETYPSAVIKNGAFAERDYRTLIQNGYNHKLSGDVCFFYQPAWMDYSEKGTTHGAAYNYDTHVPVLFYGKNIRKGESLEYTTITQIAPTVCELLRINQPNACTASPIKQLRK